jgi:hypothetical protein
MSAINFSTANQTLRQLLGNGLTYQVPRFQRDYGWTQDEWEDLWQDILETLRDDGEPAHLATASTRRTTRGARQLVDRRTTSLGT